MFLEAELNQLKQQIKDLEKENNTLKLLNKSHKKHTDEIFSFIDTFPCHIWKSSHEHNLLYINKSLQKFVGTDSQKLNKDEMFTVIHPDDIQFYTNTLNSATENQHFFTIDYRIKKNNESYKWIRNLGAPYFKENKLAGFIGICQDITKDKVNEKKLTTLLASKDRFFSVMAHDLRNPFNSILGFSELLTDSNQSFDEQKIKRIGKHLYSSTKKTLNLLENLLEWGRLQSNHISFNPISINLKEACTEVIDNIVPLDILKKCKINNKIDTSIKVLADINMLHSVFRNLITNALKYTSKKGVINISAQNNATTVQITIEDNGIGIEAFRIKNLFNIHKKFSLPGTQGEKGSGLGLIICKEFIEKNNGDIWAESELGKGSKFIFTLPFPRAPISLNKSD